MYESKNDPLLPRHHFRRRLVQHVFYALLILFVTLAIGVIGHIALEEISWHDAFITTTFIISGLGTLVMPTTVAGKVFIAIYSLLVNLVLIGTLATVLAPIAHRLAHKFHLDDDDDDDDD